MRNPYTPLTQQEIESKEQDKKDIATRIENLTKQAAECLDDPKFKKYKEEFEAFREEVLIKLARPIMDDPIQDAYYLRACMNTIIVLGMLITKPEKDKKRR